MNYSLPFGLTNPHPNDRMRGWPRGGQRVALGVDKKEGLTPTRHVSPCISTI